MSAGGRRKKEKMHYWALLCISTSYLVITHALPTRSDAVICSTIAIQKGKLRQVHSDLQCKISAVFVRTNLTYFPE